ncbi:MAG: hypothetical protein AAF560_25225 [Acidobacteriota bacterium]
MLLFRSEEHVDSWCEKWRQPRGEVFSLPQQWGLAKAWYSDRLEPDWRRKTPEEAVAILTELGLTSPFWDLG